ncbi:MAG TPA: hypothetical protein VD793_00505, partial [Gemmatimonadales bacterium]|nr:hypothetical protein [Gemmatimonadales bacterium]
YRDGSGDVWLGQQRRPKATGWSVVQPVAGPLTPPGLRLALVGTARDTAGPAAARAGLTLIILGKSSRPVWIGPDRPESLRDSVVVQVAFRNGLR